MSEPEDSEADVGSTAADADEQQDGDGAAQSAHGEAEASEADPSDTSWWAEQLHTVSIPSLETPLTRTGLVGLALSIVAFLGMVLLWATLVAAVGVLLSVHGLIEVRNGKRRGIAYPIAGIAVGSVAFLAAILFYVALNL